jgi:predicted phosphodiesterase
MLAIISDIHANTEALLAVLGDIKQRGIETIVCLGDIVGYGPDPGLAVDLVMGRCSVAIMGNHDYATIHEPTHFNIGAERAIYWTRRALKHHDDSEVVQRRLEFLGRLEMRHIMDGLEHGVREIMLAHGTPRRPVNEYIFPDDVNIQRTKIAASLERIEHVCFVGHTHLPGVFTSSMTFMSPQELNNEYTIHEKKAIINVGSVGQPRDRDPRASYVVLDQGRVSFVRVDYNVQATVDKIRDTHELDNYLGARLEDGR